MDKKKIKINLFDKEEPSYTEEDIRRGDVHVDSSADELKLLRQQMLQRRIERENEEDEDGIVIKQRPQSRFQRLLNLMKG